MLPDIEQLNRLYSLGIKMFFKAEESWKQIAVGREMVKWYTRMLEYYGFTLKSHVIKEYLISRGPVRVPVLILVWSAM